MNLLRTALILVLILAPAAAWSQQIQGDGENAPELITRPYDYVSDQGNFKVTWPSGCGELVRRDMIENPDAEPFDQVQVFNVYCDQNKQHGVGSAVIVLFNLRDGEGRLPGPAQVVPRMENHLQTLGVAIVEQRPIRRDMPGGTCIEGLEILAQEPAGAGQAWLRGLIHEDVVYLLSAWKIEGGLFDDPEYEAFFNSFEPVVE
ncbi:MAG: hypothetical protein ABR506_08470 [Candidatus Krumholzibacteriia bacterium]